MIETSYFDTIRNSFDYLPNTIKGIISVLIGVTGVIIEIILFAIKKETTHERMIAAINATIMVASVVLILVGIYEIISMRSTMLWHPFRNVSDMLKGIFYFLIGVAEMIIEIIYFAVNKKTNVKI